MNTLLVEGYNDEFIIQKLLKRRKIEFENFEIKSCNNVDKLLRILPDTILLKTNEDVIGIIVDADENLAERWKKLRDILIKVKFQDVPQSTNIKGIILKADENDELPQVGVWLMPNNKLNGRIEDFIKFLVPSDDDLLPLAEKKVDDLISKEKNRFTIPHKSKAVIHTWLAWQERPGTQLGAAVTYRVAKTLEHILDDKNATDFIEWLKKLFK
ncbi:DUF4276 family protein [Candidatus Magnetomoraceae bacterium gMMP-15]